MDLTIEGPSARLGKWGDDGVPQRGWARTRCGHATIKTEGYEVTLFPRGGEWGGKLVRLRDRDMTFMRRTYPTERAAKLASFDVLQFVRAKRGEAA